MAPPSSLASEPTRASSRKRIPSAKALPQPEPEHQSSGKRPLKMASSANATAGSAKKKTTKAKATRKKLRTCAKEGDQDGDDICADEPDEEELALAEENELAEQEEEQAAVGPPTRTRRRPVIRRRVAKPRRVQGSGNHDHEFVGEPIPQDEALKAWPTRYQSSRAKGEARAHYRQAKIEDTIYSLNDDVYVKAAEGKTDFLGRIAEFFEGTDSRQYFTCRWFYRPEETVISTMILEKGTDHKHDPIRVFLSEDKDDISLDCILSKIKIVYVDPNLNSISKAEKLVECQFYYDMSYSEAFSTFANIPSENGPIISDTASKFSGDTVDLGETSAKKATLLDLYSGCGGLSTGLCLGAALAGVKLETRWAVDFNEFACKSLKYNHPDTQVRNEKAEDYLVLLKEWAVLCDKYVHNVVHSDSVDPLEDEEEDDGPLGEDEYVVDKVIGICYGGTGKENTIYFKVQWEGYDSDEDSWEPVGNLSDCALKIKEFVEEGHRLKILPLPGDVDVICGGPPCQGISGFNRFRDSNNPLQDEKNRQLITFMDIVEYLKPNYVLMENVVDMVKFAEGYLASYALSRLVSLNYQARLGMMVAGCYGLPQFRMRVFLWGALPTMVLPKYPLPTHKVVWRGGIPTSFSQSIVYDETQESTLKEALLLGEAISDLPEIGNHQPNEIMEYGGNPRSDFQQYIQISRKDMLDYSYEHKVCSEDGKLLDHQPLQLNKDDLARVQQIPKKKGANFRCLRGVRVGEGNKVEFDPEIERVYLDSGKPLVPDYAMSFVGGKSKKPFGRLWKDETVATVVTRAEPHNQIILHPDQDRVLSVRENARLQGFPDYYRMWGPIKQKYIQVGNAVAIPVARALGYSLGQAYKGNSEGLDQALFVLPNSFTSLGQAAVPDVNIHSPVGELVE
ncbi:DNA (cytosine-5)-methyltransferase CMT3-like [Lolium rigidum]|uniref:DNA (cytosine-5)-methyltransferase CMT3-like n=1 Tax=Lolium rigidum TaxID=89674 RepID=UPI001F5E0602|nr:DNA (cytosine-5)-methyltransferase CMT3-like [Lolium rigidum]